MQDTTERDRALRDLEKEKEMRRKSELEAAQARLQAQQYTEESRRLREELDRMRAELSTFR
jgi:E3 ubiquitin-protein ligase RFWD3